MADTRRGGGSSRVHLFELQRGAGLRREHDGD